MFNDNRGSTIVVSVLIILFISGLLGWALNPEQPKLSGNADYQAVSTNYHPGGPDCQPMEIDKLAVAERSIKSVACEESAEQYRLASNDLIQQRRSADAADAMTILSYQQTRIAAWGVALGFITMFAAIAAAFYARRAAAATEDTVKIALDAVHESRDANRIAQNAQRPWVTSGIVPLSITPSTAGHSDVWYELTVENRGETAATGMSISHFAFAASNDASADYAKIISYRTGIRIDRMVDCLPPKASDSQRLYLDMLTPNSEPEWPRYCIIIVVDIRYAGGRSLETWLIGQRSRTDGPSDRPLEIRDGDTLYKNNIAKSPYRHRKYE